MKNLFRPLLVLTGCIVLASCVSQKQFKGLKTDYTKLLQKSEMRKEIVIELSYKGFSRASDYS